MENFPLNLGDFKNSLTSHELESLHSFGTLFITKVKMIGI